MIFCTQLLPSWLLLLLLVLLLSLFYKHFYEQFIFTPSTKPAASQTVDRCLLAGGKNIDTETETENQKPKYKKWKLHAKIQEKTTITISKLKIYCIHIKSVC